MEKWRERLAGIDDDYLIGISNKGIVKRAYKDMEEGLSGGEQVHLPLQEHLPPCGAWDSASEREMPGGPWGGCGGKRPGAAGIRA